MPATTVFTAISAAAALTTQLNNIKQKGASVMGAARAVGNYTDALSGQTSLTDVAKLTRAEFFTVIDNDCLNIDFLSDVKQSALNIAIGYYLQAIAVLGAVDSAKVTNTLARVTPTATPVYNPSAGGSSIMFSKESYASGRDGTIDGTFKLAAESYQWKLPLNSDALSLEAKDGGGGGFREVGFLNSSSNLSVGKMVEVTLSDSEDSNSKVKLPVSFKLSVSTSPSDAIVSALSLDNRNTTMTERYHAWRMGDISFWKDFILCQDMIKERKKLMMSNKNGAIHKMIERSNSGRITGLMNGKPSMAAATAIFMMSSTTAEELETKLSGSLSSVNIRNKIFQSGHMMLLVVIDKAYEQVTFYHRDIAEPTVLTLRDMKMANKDTGPNLTDIMKAFMMGNSPTF